jgi:signal transduction histidine kinase
MNNMNISIRSKLSILYTAVLFALLTAFCIILYSAVAFSLKTKSRNELLRYAHKLSETYDNDTQTFTDLPEGDFSVNPSFWFRIIKPDGNLYRPAPVFQIMKNSVKIEQIRNNSKKDPRFYDFKEEGQWFSSVIYPITEGYVFSGWVEVVISVSDEKIILARIRMLMGVLGMSVVILLFYSGRFLARKTLDPVQQVRRQVDAIYEKNLSTRIVSSNPDDEIGQLAETFNNLLQRLEKAFDSQQQFIADASHELKTPLTILRTQWEKLAAQRELPYEYRVKIQTDIEELARLSNLINNLLLLATPGNKNGNEEHFLINLSELVNAFYEDIQFLAENKQQKVLVSIDDNISIIGDKVRIYQLLLNLADNAIKYTPDNGIIEIILSREVGHAIFTIKDNGIGISVEHLPYIFERFYRVDKSRSRQSGGYGLGLAVCKTIVEAHKGLITLTSNTSGGTTVVVKLPVA